jgi:hypothetical protein
MAESNLRAVLVAARGRGATSAPTDNEMEAVLRILKRPSEPIDGGDRAGDGAEQAPDGANGSERAGEPAPDATGE